MEIQSQTTTVQFAITETYEGTLPVASEQSNNKACSFESLHISSIKSEASHLTKLSDPFSLHIKF